MMIWIRFAVDVASVVWWARLVVRVAARPARRWRTAWFGKSVSLIASLVLVSLSMGLFVPYGAAVVWWRVLVRAATRSSCRWPTAGG